MRALVLCAILGCTPARPPPAPPVPIENTSRGCGEAAAGLERATRGVRPPEESVLGPMRERCNEDAWPVAAIDCFATMNGDDLGRCAGLLAAKPRDALFAVIGGSRDDRATLAVIVARLANLRVGISACDEFVAAVSRAMACDQLAVETRTDLGNETADFWSLPTSGLPADAQQRMVTACTESREALAQQVTAVGCMP